jgi:hypothetical protein
MPPRNSTKMLGITAHFRRQDGKLVDPPLPEFNRSWYTYRSTLSGSQTIHTRAALEGNPAWVSVNLMHGFKWISTPQGYEYWSSIYESATELLPEDRDYLEWLLEEHS